MGAGFIWKKQLLAVYLKDQFWKATVGTFCLPNFFGFSQVFHSKLYL